MRVQIVTCGLLAGILALYVHTPTVRVNAQAKTSSPNAITIKVDPQKEAQIRELMDLTGARDLGQQLMQAGLEQFRSSVEESQPNNPRAKQFMDAFASKFQKHFDPK